MSILRPVVLVLLPLESTLLRWRLLPWTLPRPIWLSFSRTCFREKSWVLIRHWCIGYPYLSKPSLNLHVHPSSSLQVLQWRFTSFWFYPYTSPTCYRISVLACLHAQASSSLPLSPIATPSSAEMLSLLCQLSWHTHSPVGIVPLLFVWLILVIGASFPSPPPFHQVNIRHGCHHANLCVGAYNHPHHKSRFPVPQYSMACGMRQCRQEFSLKRCGYRPCSPPEQGIVRGGRSGTTMPIHLTDTCRWRLYDSFDAHSQLRINDNHHRYQSLMHRLSILWGYQSASSGATRSVTNTMLVWDTGALIGLTQFHSDFIDYFLLDGVTVKVLLRRTLC